MALAFFRTVGSLTRAWRSGSPSDPISMALDRVIIGNVSRTMEQLPNYAASDKGFFAQEVIQGDVVLIGSTDTLIQALIAGQINVAIVDPSAAINAVERGASLKIIGGTVPIAAYTLVGCPKYKSIKELKGTTIGVVSLVSGSTIFLREMLKANGLERIAITRSFRTARPASDWQA